MRAQGRIDRQHAIAIVARKFVNRIVEPRPSEGKVALKPRQAAIDIGMIHPVDTQGDRFVLIHLGQHVFTQLQRSTHTGLPAQLDHPAADHHPDGRPHLPPYGKDGVQRLQAGLAHQHDKGPRRVHRHLEQRFTRVEQDGARLRSETHLDRTGCVEVDSAAIGQGDGANLALIGCVPVCKSDEPPPPPSPPPELVEPTCAKTRSTSGSPRSRAVTSRKAQATGLTPDEKKAVAGFASIIKTAAGIAEEDA